MGVERLLLATVLESSSDLERIRKAVPEADIQVFLLTSPLHGCTARRAQQVPTAPGRRLDRSKWLVERWEQEPLAHAQVIDADDSPPVKIAAEIIARSGWLEWACRCGRLPRDRAPRSAASSGCAALRPPGSGRTAGRRMQRLIVG